MATLAASPARPIELHTIRPSRRRAVSARRASGAERDRLWATFDDFPGWGADLGALAANRPTETAVVIFEPTKGTDR